MCICYAWSLKTTLSEHLKTIHTHAKTRTMTSNAQEVVTFESTISTISTPYKYLHVQSDDTVIKNQVW